MTTNFLEVDKAKKPKSSKLTKGNIYCCCCCNKEKTNKIDYQKKVYGLLDISTMIKHLFLVQKINNMNENKLLNNVNNVNKKFNHESNSKIIDGEKKNNKKKKKEYEEKVEEGNAINM